MKTNSKNQTGNISQTTQETQVSEVQKTAIQLKREQLKEISAPFKQLLKEGKIQHINEGLTEYYAKNGYTNLKTINQWNQEGKNVIKGEKALLLWGSPKRVKHEDEEAERDYFPICFVFSEQQVKERA